MRVLEQVHDKMLTTKEVAQVLGVTYRYVCQLIREGKMNGTRIGDRVYLVPEKEARKFADPNKVGRPRSGFVSQMQ